MPFTLDDRGLVRVETALVGLVDELAVACRVRCQEPRVRDDADATEVEPIGSFDEGRPRLVRLVQEEAADAAKQVEAAAEASQE